MLGMLLLHCKQKPGAADQKHIPGGRIAEDEFLGAG
jgi:hypothetical protein